MEDKDKEFYDHPMYNSLIGIVRSVDAINQKIRDENSSLKAEVERLRAIIRGAANDVDEIHRSARTIVIDLDKVLEPGETP